MKTNISHTKNVQLMSPEFVDSRLRFLQEERLKSPDDLNGRLEPQYSSTDYEAGTMTVKYRTSDWEMNRVGILHGGIISSMTDHTASSAVYAFIGHWCPTLDLDIKFISQASLGDSLTCVGRVIHCGERFITSECTITNDTNGRLVATALMTSANGARTADAIRKQQPSA